MELIPAIDVLGGRIVRLREGRYDAVTTYDVDPLALATAYRAAGATRLHVVDLDGARDGKPGNFELLHALVARAGVRVQVGGGIRDVEAASRWLEAGADRVVLGTLVVRAPDRVRALSEAHPGRVVVALDARSGEVAVEGWLQSSGRRVDDLAREVDAWGVGAILFTAIERDGTGLGPDVAATARLQSLVRADVIASGGIGSVEHLRGLAAAGVRASVCGRALLEGAIRIEEAIEAARGNA